MSRRRYLLSLLTNNEKYIESVFAYVYFSLLNDANLRDSGKAKLNTIYGNGVIENQLVEPKTNATSSDVNVVYDENTKTFHITGTPSNDVYLSLNASPIETFVNHKYYLSGCQTGGSTTTYYIYIGGNASNPDVGNGSIFTVSTASSTRQITLYIRSGTTVDIYVKPQLIDLTLMFGTGNEPTSTSDNRIQELLNRGVIAYNTGEYKASKVGEISFNKADTTFLSKISLPNTLELGGAISAHDTFEITKENYVFTRNVWKVDLGTLTWSASGGTGNASSTGLINSAKPPLTNNDLGNIISSFGRTETYNATWGAEKIVSLNASGTLYVKLPNNPNESAENVKALVSGYPLKYEIATPQTITIPRKHLGCVDLGSLNWNYSSGYFISVFPLDNARIDVRTNIYCSMYITTTQVGINMGINIASNGRIRINNDKYGTDTNVFKQAMSGVYLFYETESEVADFVDKAKYEKGGTITTNEYSWVENQLVQNGNFVDTSNWFNNNSTLTVSNNVGTMLASASSGSIEQSILCQENHKYLVYAKIKTTTQTNTIVLRFAGTDLVISTLTTDWQTLSAISSNSSTGNKYFVIRDTRTSGWDNIEIKDVMCIDLTLAFGSGNEPTSVDDFRIQNILNKGYIPTNTSGTEKAESTKILCNLKMLMQK